MPHYLIQAAYTPEGWAALVKTPQNRVEAIRPSIENLGGQIEGAWFTFGDYDIIVVVQMPDNVRAAGIAMAYASGGACKSVKRTPLLTDAGGVQAMTKGGQAGYAA